MTDYPYTRIVAAQAAPNTDLYTAVEIHIENVYSVGVDEADLVQVIKDYLGGLPLTATVVADKYAVTTTSA